MVRKIAYRLTYTLTDGTEVRKIMPHPLKIVRRHVKWLRDNPAVRGTVIEVERIRHDDKGIGG